MFDTFGTEPEPEHYVRVHPEAEPEPDTPEHNVQVRFWFEPDTPEHNVQVRFWFEPGSNQNLYIKLYNVDYVVQLSI